MDMDWKCSLASAGNTDNPALYLLHEEGYELSVNVIEERCLYIAAKDGRRFVGNSGPELLGLVSLWKCFGDDCLSAFQEVPDILADIPHDED